MPDRWSRELDDPRRAHAPAPEYVPAEERRPGLRWRRLVPTLLVAVALGLALTSALHHGRVYGHPDTHLVPPRRPPDARSRSAACPHGEATCAAHPAVKR